MSNRVDFRLRSRFEDMWKQLGLPHAAEVYKDLVHHYAEAGRFYHRLVHIENCLKEFDAAKHLATNPLAVECALWFHDVIWEAHASDNEERSTEYALDAIADTPLGRSFCESVERHILATKHLVVPEDPDSQLIVDIDLASLGYLPADFDHHSAQVRQELGLLPESVFKEKQSMLFERLLQRPSIYLTEFFRAKYEQQARKNIGWAIDLVAT